MRDLIKWLLPNVPTEMREALDTLLCDAWDGLKYANTDEQRARLHEYVAARARLKRMGTD